MTSLALLGTSGERVSVHIDGSPAFEVSAEVALAGDLKQGMELAEDAQVQLLEMDEPYRARNAALTMLSRRDRCAKEISSKLRSSGYGEESACAAVRWLEERGFVDDRRFAAWYASEKMRAGWGRRRIVAELMKKGVARDVLAADGWEQLVGEHAVEQTAESLAAEIGRRFGSQLQKDPVVGRRRIEGFLARRGHDWETIRGVLASLDGLDGDEWGLGEP